MACFGLIRKRTTRGVAESASWWSIPRAEQPRAASTWRRSTPDARQSSTPTWLSMCRRPPVPSRSSGERDRTVGFIPFIAHTEDDVGVNYRPTRDVGTPTIRVRAARGERQAAQLGLYPVARFRGVKVSVDDLVLANATSDTKWRIPASAVQVRKVRNFLKGEGSSRMGNLLPTSSRSSILSICNRASPGPSG